MPYISQESRKKIKENNYSGLSYGDMVYIIYCHLLKIWNRKKSFKIIFLTYRKYVEFDIVHLSRFLLLLESKSDCIGNHIFRLTDLLCASKLAWFEMKRRYFDKYEDEKIKENGDIFSEDL